MTDVAMFVYGTLMTDQPLHPWIKDAVIDSEDATLGGHRLEWHPKLGYPRAVQGIGMIRGQVLWVDSEHPAVQRTMDMEIRAGYELRVLDVETEGETEPLPALCFIADGPQGQWLRVPGNDWRHLREVMSG